MKSFLFLLLLISCSPAHIRRLNPDGFVKTADREFDVYHSKRGLANLEIFSSEGEKGDMNDAVLKAFIENGSDEELTIDLRDIYQWSAWFRWQRKPKATSAGIITLKPFERKEISLTWMRREYGILIAPFRVGSVEDEFQVKFENCASWAKCETEFTK